MNKEILNQKLLEMMNNYKLFKSNLFIQYLEMRADVNIQNKDGNTPLIFIFKYTKSIYIQKFFVKELLKKCDVNIKNNNGETVLKYILENNNEPSICQEIVRDKKLMSTLINKANLNINFILFSETLFFKILNNREINFSNKELKSLFLKLNKRYQQMVFKDACREFSYDNNDKNLLFLLYDCKLNISQQTQNWVIRKKYETILQIIEKRNIYFELNKNLDHKKINTFKI